LLKFTKNQIGKTCKKQMFSSRSFAARLERVDGSVPSIQAISRYISIQISHAPKFSAPLEVAMSRADAQKRLVLLYLMNDVLQSNKPKAESLFNEAFERPLKRGFALIGQSKGDVSGGGAEFYRKAERLLDIWKTRDTLSITQLDVLRRALLNWNDVLNGEGSEVNGAEFDLGGSMSDMGFTPMTPMMQDTDEHVNNDTKTRTASTTVSSQPSALEDEKVKSQQMSLSSSSTTAPPPPPRSNSPLSLLEAEVEALSGILGSSSSSPHHSSDSSQTAAALNLIPLTSELALAKAKTYLSAVEAAEVSVGLSSMDVTGLTARLNRVVAVDKSALSIIKSSVPFDASSALETVARHLKSLRAEKRAREEATTALTALLESEASLVDEDETAVNKALEQLHSSRARREMVRKIRDEAVASADAAEAATREAKLQAAARAAAEAKKLADEALEAGKEEDGELQGIDIVKDVTSLLSLASRTEVPTAPPSSSVHAIVPPQPPVGLSSSMNASRLLSSIMGGKKPSESIPNTNSSISLLGAPAAFQPPLIFNNSGPALPQQQHLPHLAYSSFPQSQQIPQYPMPLIPQGAMNAPNVLLPYQQPSIGALQWNNQPPQQFHQPQYQQHLQQQSNLPFSSKSPAPSAPRGRGLGATIPAWMR
jgi:hypothetical protein